MSFQPDYMYRRISDIPIDKLKAAGIRGLILDIDNTLTTHDNPQPSQGVRQWLDQAEEAGMKLIILSNNKPHRVKPFAEILKLPFAANGKKPLKEGYVRCARLMGCHPKETAIIGDQVFTDILGGKFFGCTTILVEPIQPEPMLFFKVKRKLEKLVLRKDCDRKL